MSPISIPGKIQLRKNYSGIGPSAWRITGKYYDEHFSNVSLLLHGDGANGSTNIVDSSPSPKTVTAVGNAQISTAQSKFGSSSLYTPQADADIFNFTNIGSSLEFPGDYTIECWHYVPTFTGFLANSVYVTSNVAANAYHAFNVTATNYNLYFNSQVFTAIAHGFTAATWHHIALCRSGSTVRVFTDGVQKGSVTSSITHGYPLGSVGLARIGGGASNAGARYIDDLRITKGVARYTSNFTPPTQPLPNY